MSFKLRFALLFSLLVLIILSASSVFILVSNESYRKQEFYQRLSLEATKASEIYFGQNNQQDGALKLKYMLSTLPEESVLMLDQTGNVLFATPGLQPKLSKQLLEQAFKTKAHYFTVNDRETSVEYKTSPAPHYVIVSAFDKYGRSKANNLLYILIFSSLGGLVLSAFLAFFYVRQVFKPLNHLKAQMRKINEENLTERLEVRDTDGEVGTIAKNFNDMLDRLENSFQTRKNFVQHASHELRTPLANMLSQTEVALNQDLEKEHYRRILQSLKEDQQDMISLTNSLLLLSQYDSWTHIEEWKTVRVDELVYETIDITKNVFRNAVITVDFETVPENEEDLLYKGNEMLLKSAFQNLIRNACNYSEDNLVIITINPQPSAITINFNNRGKQLTAEEQERLFIPFFRGDNSIHKKGFGLGLSIVQRILKLHGAQIRYYALEDNLNRFVVNLPKPK